jgi:hypothetical protein
LRGGRGEFLGVVVAIALLMGGAGCQWISGIGGRTVQVEFGRSVAVESGLAVYASTIEIGFTGAPEVLAGKVVLPVHLYRKHREAVPPEAVFVLDDDPERPGKSCFVVYDLGAELAGKAGVVGGGRYRGFASIWELALVIGREAAQELVGRVERALDPPVSDTNAN